MECKDNGRVAQKVEREKQRWGGRYKDRQGSRTEAQGGQAETRGGRDREMGWERRHWRKSGRHRREQREGRQLGEGGNNGKGKSKEEEGRR